MCDTHFSLIRLQLWIYDMGMAEWTKRLSVSISICCSLQISGHLWIGQQATYGEHFVHEFEHIRLLVVLCEKLSCNMQRGKTQISLCIHTD